MIWAPDHPRAVGKTKYVFEHILVMEEMLGRHLFPDENVHHINGVRDDNRPENLELWTRPQPAGIRASDALAWAHEIIARYGVPRPSSPPAKGSIAWACAVMDRLEAEAGITATARRPAAGPAHEGSRRSPRHKEAAPAQYRSRFEYRGTGTPPTPLRFSKNTE